MTKTYLKNASVLALSALLILATMWFKNIKTPGSVAITGNTFLGLGSLFIFAMIGIVITDLAKLTPIKIFQEFPPMGWVSITSLIACLLWSPFITYINSVDFLSITTPILAFAGVSVVNQLDDLKDSSWKFVIVAAFVFLGTYLGASLVAQLGLMISGK